MSTPSTGPVTQTAAVQAKGKPPSEGGVFMNATARLQRTGTVREFPKGSPTAEQVRRESFAV